MLLEERRNNIVKLLKRNGKISVEEVSSSLDVSAMTIRRDLMYLEDKGIIHRTHGGAILSDILINEEPYKMKETLNREEKDNIAIKAAQLITKGQSILLDAGTTCLALAQHIKLMEDITVITTDLRIALELYKNPKINLICTGGTVQPNIGAMIGNYAETLIDSINVDISFIGVASVDENFIASTPTIEKAVIKKKAIESANKAVILADHSKFTKKSLHKVCNIREVDVLISDSKLDNELAELITDKIRRLILA